MWGPPHHLRRAGRAGEPAGQPPEGQRGGRGRPRRALPDEQRRVPRGPPRRLQAAGGPHQRELPLRGGRAPLPVRRRRDEGGGPRRRVHRPHGRHPGPAARARGRDGPRPRLRGGAGRGRPRPGRGGAEQRRPLHPLHGRHDRHAEGRGVAPGGRLPLLHRGRRPVPHAGCHHDARGDRRAHHAAGLDRHLPARGPADARRGAVDQPVVAVRRREGRPPPRLARPPRRVGDGRRARASTSSPSWATRWPGPCSTPGTSTVATTCPRSSSSGPVGRRSAPRCASACRRPSPTRSWPTASARRRRGHRAPPVPRPATTPAPPSPRWTTRPSSSTRPCSRCRQGPDTVGRVARTGHIPLRYHGDPEKTAETFVELDGRRWVITGDMARVAEDGTIELLGRGSGCINTGGEKVFPEEVESVLRERDDVYDVLVVGAPDERWGERVAAIVQPAPGSAPTADDAHRALPRATWPATSCRSRCLRGPGRALARGQARLPLGQGRRQRLTVRALSGGPSPCWARPPAGRAGSGPRTARRPHRRRRRTSRRRPRPHR